MKTYDGVELIKNVYSKYPEGSLSPREVLLTLPTSNDAEQFATKLNSAITYAIYKSAENYLKSLPSKEPQNFKFTAVADLKVKVDDTKERNTALTTSVLDAIISFNP